MAQFNLFSGKMKPTKICIFKRISNSFRRNCKLFKLITIKLSTDRNLYEKLPFFHFYRFKIFFYIWLNSFPEVHFRAFIGSDYREDVSTFWNFPFFYLLSKHSGSWPLEFLLDRSQLPSSWLLNSTLVLLQSSNSQFALHWHLALSPNLYPSLVLLSGDSAGRSGQPDCKKWYQKMQKLELKIARLIYSLEKWNQWKLVFLKRCSNIFCRNFGNDIF